MIEIVGIVLNEDQSLTGFIVKDIWRKRIYSKETIAKKIREAQNQKWLCKKRKTGWS